MPARKPGRARREAGQLRIVVDENIPGCAETFGRHGQVTTVAGRGLDAGLVKHADALIVRSVTRVGPELLNGSSVSFVGSATIGTDHLDVDWLASRGIRWANAPGCNADAAAQYSLALMVLAARRLDFRLQTCHFGIVGHGNVGSRVGRLLRVVGASRIVACDPPLAAAGTSGLGAMREIAGCDVISLHVPLTRGGRWPTRHLLDAGFFGKLRPGAVVVNTARGEVIDPDALHDWLIAGRGHAALDVWPGEPEIPLGLANAAVVGTPHVAGYSLDGKLRGSLQVYEAFCGWLGVATGSNALLESLPRQPLPPTAAESVESAILAACPVERDDAALRAILADDAAVRGEAFDALRRTYPDRRDFAGWSLPGSLDRARHRALTDLGFH